MIKLKRLSKRTLSLLLALVLVITTFFIFDPDLLRVDSDAYANVQTVTQASALADQNVYAPETIYLNPGTRNFEYFMNYDRNTGKVTSAKDSSGQIYFKNDDATEVALAVNNVYKNDANKTQATAGTLTVGGTNITQYAGLTDGADKDNNFGNAVFTSVSGGTLTYAITTGSFTYHDNTEKDGMYFIEWVIRYKIDKVYRYTFAYTGIYVIPLTQAGISYRTQRSSSSNNPDHAAYAFVTGAMAYGGGNATSKITNRNYVNIAGGITDANVTAPLVAFVGRVGDKSSGDNYTFPGDNKITNAFESTRLFDTSKSGGGVAMKSGTYTNPGESNDPIYFRTTEWEKEGSYADPNPKATSIGTGSLGMTTGVAYMVVDTSRYSDYADVPYLSAGWAQFNYHYHGDGNKLDSIAMYNGTGTGDAISGTGLSVETGNYKDGDEDGNSYVRGLYHLKGAIQNGMRTIEIYAWNATSGGRYNRVRSYIGFYTQQNNKEVLRQNYQLAQNSICDYENLVTNEKNAGLDGNGYKEYYALVKAVAEVLCDPTSTNTSIDHNSLKTKVERYEKTIVDQFGSDLYFYVPEVIYTKPQGSYNANAVHYGGVYVNNDASANKANPNLNTGDCKYGMVTFDYPNAQDIHISYTLEGNKISNASSTVTFSNSSSATSGTTINVNSGSYNFGESGVKYIVGSSFQMAANGTQAGTETGYWIKWTASYYDKLDGRTKEVTAYTYVYRTFYLSVQAAAQGGVNKSGSSNDVWMAGHVWASGIHGFDSSGSNRYTKTKTEKYNLPIGYEVNITSLSNSSVLTEDSDTDDSAGNPIKANLYRYVFDSDAKHYFQAYSLGNGPDGEDNIAQWLGTSVDYAEYYPSYLGGNVKFSEGGEHNHDTASSATSPLGKMTVDTSRYTNLNQVPGFNVGAQQTDDEDTDRGTWYIADYTGRTQTDGVNDASGTLDWDTAYKDVDASKIFGGHTNELSYNSGQNYQNSYIKYFGKGNVELDTTQSKKTYSVKAAMLGESDGDYYRKTLSMVVRIEVTQYNKGALRNAIINATKQAPLLDANLFNTNLDEWTTYQEALRKAQQVLTMVDGSAYYDSSSNSKKTTTDYATLATDLNDAVNALLAKDANGNWSSPARLGGELEVYHYVYDPREPEKGAVAFPIINKDTTHIEERTYKYGDTITTAYEERPGYNFFGFYRSDEGKNWLEAGGGTPDLSILQGDIATQGTYGGTGRNVDEYYTGSANLTYTYVYTPAEAGVYLDLGDASTAFKNAQNLVNLEGPNVGKDWAFTEDGTYYTDATYTEGGVTYTGEKAVEEANNGEVKDAYSLTYTTNIQGRNEDTPTGRRENLINFRDGWGSVSSADKFSAVDEDRLSMRITDNVNTDRTDNYVYSNQIIKVVPGETYGFTMKYYRYGDSATSKTMFYFYSNDGSDANIANYAGLKEFEDAMTDKSGMFTYTFTVPAGTTKLRIKIGTRSSGDDVTFSNISLYNLSDYDGHEKAEMNDIFFENAAVVEASDKDRTYTVSFESSLTYDVRRWYYYNMYGTPITNAVTDDPEDDNYLGNFEEWSHDQGTIQMFISTTGVGDDGKAGTDDDKLHNYTVQPKVTTNVSVGGTIATFELPAGCTSINLGFCITNNDPMPCTINNIRIVEGDFVQYGKNKKSVTIENGQGSTEVPTRFGYTFGKWVEGDYPFDGAISADNKTYTFGKDSDTLLATWTPNKYDIAFDNEFDFDKGIYGYGGGTVTKNDEANTYYTTINSDGNVHVIPEQRITFKEGHTYRVSFDYEVSSGVSNLFFRTFNGTSTRVEKHTLSVDGTTGTASLSFTAGSTYTGVVRFDASGTEGSTAQFSDIYIQDLTRGRGGLTDTSVSEPTVVGTNLFDFSAGWESWGSGVTSKAVDNETATVTFNTDTDSSVNKYNYSKSSFDFKAGHSYLITYDYNINTTGVAFDFSAGIRGTDSSGAAKNWREGQMTVADSSGMGTYTTVVVNTYPSDLTGNLYPIFNGSNASVEISNIRVVDVTDSDVIHTLAESYNSTLSDSPVLNGNMPYMTSDNFEFAGWYKDEELTVKADINEIKITHLTQRLYSKWTVRSSFSLNGGTYLNLYDTTAPNGQSGLEIGDNTIEIPNYVPYKIGYNFAGWKASSLDTTNVNTSSTQLYQPGDIITNVCANVTFTAWWTEAETAEFDREYTAEVPYGGQVYFYKYTPAKAEYITGYTYNGFAPALYRTDKTDELGEATTSGGDGFGVKDYTAMSTGAVAAGTTVYFGIAQNGMNEFNDTKFMLKKHTVTYHFSTTDGATNIPEDVTVDYGEDVAIGAAPSRPGWIFSEWADSAGKAFKANSTISAEYTNAIISSSNDTFNTTVTLKPSWNKRYCDITVSPYYNTAVDYATTNSVYERGTIGGTVEIIGETLTADEYGALTKEYAALESTVDFKANPNTGYNFAGWYESVNTTGGTFDGLTPVENTGDEPTRFSYAVQEVDYNLYARFDLKTFNWDVVAYSNTIANPNTYAKGTGGEATVGTWTQKYYEAYGKDFDGTVVFGQSVTLWAIPATGYTFAGWYTSTDVVNTSVAISTSNPDCKLEGNAYKYTVTSPVQSNMTYVAKFSIESFILYITENGDSSVNGSTLFGYPGNTVIVYAPSKTGHDFQGWDLKRNSGTGAPFGRLTEKDNNNYEYEFGAGNDSITAKWRISEYDIVINPTGGTIDTINYTNADNQTLTASTDNSSIIISAAYNTTVYIKTPNKTGHSFAGWDITGNKGVFTPALSEDASSQYNIAANDTNVVITAKWTVNTHKMTFIAYGNSADDPTVFGENRGGTVKFDGSDKEFMTSGYDTVNYGDTRTVLAKPNTGYSFVRWELNPTADGIEKETFEPGTPNENGEYLFTTSAMPDKDVTYYAVFEINSYTVTAVATYNSAQTPQTFVEGAVGGKVGFSRENLSDRVSATYYYLNRSTVRAEAAPGYEFTGWFTSLASDTPENTSADYEIIVSDDKTIYAEFAIKKFNVKVNMMANSASDENVYNESYVCGNVVADDYDIRLGGNYYYGTSVQLTIQSRPGYQFLGWYDDNDLTIKNSEETTTITISIDQPQAYNVWAKFKMLKFNVNLYPATVNSSNIIHLEDSTGGKVGFAADILANNASAEYYTDTAFDVYAQPITGYLFEGWYRDTELTVEAVGSNSGVEDGIYHQTLTKIGDNETLYAKFKISSSILEVTVYSNTGAEPDIYRTDLVGGRVVINENAYTSNIKDLGAKFTANVIYDQRANITAIANTGYYFDGWYTDSLLSSDKCVQSNETFEPVMTKETQSYFAKFSVGSFNILFDSNGGTTFSPIKVYYGTYVDLVQYTPTRTGYAFNGWDLSSNVTTGSYTVSIETGTINSWYTNGNGSDVTLYAIWNQTAYSIYAHAAYHTGSGAYKRGNVGGTVDVVVALGGEYDETNNVVMVTPGAGVQDFLRMTPATGYKVEQWRYVASSSTSVPDQFSSINSWGQEGAGGTTMPQGTLNVVVFFTQNSFDLSFFAYNNSAGEIGSKNFTNSATGGTVRVGESGIASSKASIYDSMYLKNESSFAKNNAGYEFVGWYRYTAPDENGVIADTAFNNDTFVTANVELTVQSNDNTTEANRYINHYIAVFEIKQYSAMASVRTYAVSEDLVLTDPDTYDQTGGNATNKGGNVGIGTSKDDLKWTEAVGGNQRSVTVYYRQKVYYKAEAATGYYFAGWYGEEGAKYYGDALVDEFNSTYTRSQPARDTYLEAKFFPETFTLIYDANGGAPGNPMEIQVTYNGEFTYNDAANPTKLGFNFMGWANTPEGEVVSAYNAKTITGSTITLWYNLRDTDTGCCTIFAQWGIAEIIVTLEKEGADVSTGVTEVEVQQGETLPTISELPVYDGYIFGGYYTQPGGQGEQRYTAEGTSTYKWNAGNGTLYAYWKTPVLENVEYKDGKWTYYYADSDGGTYLLDLSEQKPITTMGEITNATVKANITDDVKWISSIEAVNTTFVDTQIELAEDINLNHYNQAALTDLLNSVKAIDTQDIKDISQPLANQYVAAMATSMDLDYTLNRKSESVKPTVTIYENDTKLGLVKAETQLKNSSNNGFQYPVPNGDKAASYAFANKYSYTKGEAVDYYLYTNTPNPVIAVEIGDGAVATNAANNNSSYPTKATVSDNAAAFSYVKNSGEAYIESAVPATDDTSNAWFNSYTKAGIGTSHDYNAKTVIYLTPEFSSSGTQNEIVYTVKPSDDAYVVNEGVKTDGASLGGDQAVMFSSYNYEMPEDTEINICVCYHNAMNGESDEGTSDGSGGYLQMYIDQVNADKYLNQMHLFRVSGGASNWELPTSSEDVYPINDATYPYELTQKQIFGSFMYVFDSTNESYAASRAAAGDYTGAKDAIIQSIKENAVNARAGIMNRGNALNINSSGTGLGFAQITGWSSNFYPKEGSYVYAHLVDRWGNVFNRVWKCFKVDQYASTINQTGSNAYAVYETGGSNIKNITLDGANVTFNLDSTSSYQNGVLTTTGNTLALSTGEANKTYNLTVTDNATNKTTATVITDSNGMIVLDVQDSELNPNEGAYSFTLNGETVNLYAGKPSVLRDASVAPTAIHGENIIFTAKTSSDAIKVQIVEGSATWTYDITNPLATVVKNDDGTLTWTIPVRAAYDGKHTFGVRAKTMAGWEEIKYYLPCEVIVKNVVSAVALQSVYNAEAFIGERPTIKARAIVGTQKLQVVYANGGTITYSRSDATILSTVDGVETWALSVSPYSSVGSYTVDVIAKFEGQWQKYNAKTSTITIKSKNAAENAIIHSVEFDEEAPRGKYATFTVLTSAETAKIRFNFPATTTTFTPSNATVVENPDGTKLWTVKVRFWSKGEQDVNFSARTTAPEWTEGKVFGTITVK